MPRIRSDDQALSLRNPWLGPAGLTLPVQWSYARWGVSVGLATVFGWTLFLLLSAAGSVQAGVMAALTFGTVGGFWLGWRLTDGTTFDEPLPYRVAVWWRDRRLARRPADTTPTRFVASLPPVGELSPGARRAI